MNNYLNQDSLRYRHQCPFTELQKICFLKFVLSFGLNFMNIENLHVQLAKFNPGAFKQN